MRVLVSQMLACANMNLFYPAIMTACSIPDICAALESNDGRTNSTKYIKWWDAYAAKYYEGKLTGSESYYLRCSVLHQGRVIPHKVQRYKAIGFIEALQPATGSDFHFTEGVDFQNQMYHIKVPLHCKRIFQAVDDWLKIVESTHTYKTNYDKFFKRSKSENITGIYDIPLIIGV